MAAGLTPHQPWDQPPANPWWPPDPAGGLLQSRRSAIPVVGAGLGAGAGLPLGWQLAEWLVDSYEPFVGGPFDPGEIGNCVSVASQIVGPLDDEQDSRSQALRRDVAALYELGRHNAAPTIAAWSLVRAESKLIYTLNYDLLLEQAASDQGILFKSYTWKQMALVNRVLAQGTPSELTIVHVHGSVEHSDTIVLDGAGYAELDNDKRVEEFWSWSAQAQRLCFLGITLDEPYLVRTLQRVQGGSQQHVLVADASTLNRISQRMSLDLPRHGINKAELPDHSLLPGFAWRLASAPSAPTASAKLIAADPDAQLPLYVSNALVEPDPDRSEDVSSLLAEWDFEGTLRWRRMFSSPQRTFREPDVAAVLDRALIIGGPGSGKTELMRHTGTLVPGDYAPVFIRLSSVRQRPGDPAITLARWAETGVGLRDHVDVSMDALANTSLHFFLDALDEVPVAQLADAVARILEFSERFPQHRFTVSTRPIDGLDGFMNGRWQLLRITPTHRWQDEYLKARGLDWRQDIAPLLQGINDAREVLRLPFFLSRVVEMSNQGQLASQQDLWGLLQALVTDALEREEGELDLRPKEARDWVRRVAVAMLLAGRATLTTQEMQQIPLPASITANHEELCDTLVLRLMLRPADAAGEIGFTHRFFAAALAAEALDELGPTGVLLDALVPHSSELISGVRRDALVPLTLLMARNDAWRKAVAERDLVAATRTTPLAAPREEREAAARALWNRYRDWGVWMWDHDVPEIAEDARALGRLLASGELDDIVDELRAAMRGTQLDAQGNAIAVLSFAGVKDIEADLHAILTDEDIAGVISRQAALAAAELGLAALLPLIVTIAATTTDDMVAQDCSLVAMRMATPETVVQIAHELIQARNRSSRSIALSHARELATPDELIALLVDSSNEEDRHSRQADLLLDVLDNLTVASAATVRRVAYLAALWQIGADDVAAFFDQDREAAALGIADALAGHSIYTWEIMDLLALFTREEATGADWPVECHAYTRPTAPELVVDRQPEPAPVAIATPVDDATAGGGAPEDSELAALLKQPRDEATDVHIAHNSQYFATQAAELPQDLKADLARRLESWWPDKLYADTITWHDRVAGRRWQQENGAAAWVWYGPAIERA